MNPPDEHFRKLERMYLGAPTNEYFKPEIRIEHETCEIRLKAREDFFHAAHAVHGAVYFKTLDDSTFFAANSVVEDVFVLTASFEISFLKPISEGELIATAKLISNEGRVLEAHGEVKNSEGEIIATGKGVFMKSQKPLNEELGYC